MPTALNKEAKSYKTAKDNMLKKYNAFESIDGYIVDDFQMKKISVSNLIWDVKGFLEDGIIVNDSDEKWDQNAFLDEMLEKLFSENVKNRSNYVSVYEDDIREICKVVFGTPTDKWDKFPDEFMAKLEDHIVEIVWYLMRSDEGGLVKVAEEAAVEALSSLGITDYNTSEVNSFAAKIAKLLLSFGVKHPNLTITAISNIEGIGAAHYPELCLAWLQSFDKNYTPEGKAEFSSGLYRVVHINCPVNVDVYDADNNLVASIIDDMSQEVDGSSIVSYVNENGEKLVYLPATGEYSVKITATDMGHMTYSVNEYSEAVGGTNRIVNYLEVELNKDDIFTGIVPSIDVDEMDPEDSDGSTVEYQLLDPDSNEIPVDNDLSGEEALEANYTVNATSNNEEYGIVYGSDVVKTGNYVKVVAVPNEGCHFKGWYEGETLVSTESEYRFCVEKDVDLVGVFEKETVHEHEYSAEFDWSDDYKSCKVTFKCFGCEDVQTVDATIVEKTTPATETEKGETVYTATVEFNGVIYTDSKSVEIPTTKPSEPSQPSIPSQPVKPSKFNFFKWLKDVVVKLFCNICG